jgi:hypothetical protein
VTPAAPPPPPLDGRLERLQPLLVELQQRAAAVGRTGDATSVRVALDAYGRVLRELRAVALDARGRVEQAAAAVAEARDAARRRRRRAGKIATRRTVHPEPESR